MWLARAGQRPKRLVLYTANFAFSPKTAQVLGSNLRQLGIEVAVKYFEFSTLLDKLRTRGEPWDVTWLPWGTWYTDPAGFLVLLFHSTGFHGTKYEARADAVNRVTGAARGKAWTDFEADLMRTDPPVAAYMNPTTVSLLSRSYGCFRRHPVYEVDLAAACKT
jgi:ABC-type transport system substrate-binding protein